MKEIVEACNDVLTFLYGRIDYERKDAPQRTKSFKLDRMRELMRRLGNPQDQLKIVHIAGTKGKGSTAHMIAAVLRAAGLRYGLYTSPHLETLEERFVVDGNACSPTELIELIRLILPVVTEMDNLAAANKNHTGRPTFFEITTAIALLYFCQQDVDLAIVEVGLGGRLDSTNICQPCVSVITSISYDHVHLLGNTLALIATEKAGIIKPGVPVISGVLQEEPKNTIREIARQHGSPIWTIEEDFRVQTAVAEQPADQAGQPSRKNPRFDCLLDADSHQQRWLNLELGLNGVHQQNNAAVALATLACLQQQGWDIPPESFSHGLAKTCCPARIEVISDHPMVIVDTAHNPASVKSLVQYLNTQEQVSRRILIFAASHDKDIPGMLELLVPGFDVIILTHYVTNPRSLNVEHLEQECQRVLDLPAGTHADQTIPFIESCEDPSVAWNRATELADSEDLICITGSFYLAGEIRSLVIGNPVSHVRS